MIFTEFLSIETSPIFVKIQIISISVLFSSKIDSIIDNDMKNNMGERFNSNGIVD
jgi:hypothetical protein